MPDREMPESSPPVNMATDAELMHRIARHDRAAFKELFGRFAPKVRSFHLGLKATPAQADDLMQDVMLTIWRKAERYDPAKAAVSTWVFTMARNKFIDRVRKEKHSEVLMEADIERPSGDTPADDVVSLEQETLVMKTAIRNLPAEQNMVISMAFLKEMSHSEVATELGLPLGTVKSRIRLAMSSLRKELETWK